MEQQLIRRIAPMKPHGASESQLAFFVCEF